MKTYYSIVAAAIILLFASASYSAPVHAESKRHDGHHERKGEAKHHRKHKGEAKHHRKHKDERRASHTQRKHQDKNYHHNKRHSKHDYSHHKHHAHRGHHYRKHHKQHARHTHRGRHHSNVDWYVSLDLSPGYTYASNSIYYRWDDYEGQCFRVEERRDRTVWVEVPNYKCF